MELFHHGVKGQKWGVRRYQNKDGSPTYLEISRRRATKASKTKKDVDEIVNTMSSKDKRLLGMDKNEKEYLTSDQGEWVVKRFIVRDGSKPVAFFDLLRDGDDLNVAIGTRSEEQYRNKGYAKKVAKQGMEWCNKNRDLWDNIVWGADASNKASLALANDMGFKLYKESPNWKTYRYS